MRWREAVTDIVLAAGRARNLYLPKANKTSVVPARIRLGKRKKQLATATNVH
jgi:hypothetical protein